MYQSRAESVQEFSMMVMESEYIAPLFAKTSISGNIAPVAVSIEDLTPDEFVRLSRYYQWARHTLDNQHYQYENGFFDQEFYDDVTKPMIESMVPVWEQFGLLNSMRPAFAREIEPYLSGNKNAIAR